MQFASISIFESLSGENAYSHLSATVPYTTLIYTFFKKHGISFTESYIQIWKSTRVINVYSKMAQN